MARRFMPGFGLTMGITVSGLSLLVLLPIGALAFRAMQMSPTEFFEAAFTARAWAAYRLTFGMAAISAAITAVLGLIIAWVLVRYDFPGRGLADAVVDLPFALPTAVAGIALTALYAPSGWFGAPLEALGIRVAFTPLGVGMAMMFIGLPFVVRTVQPVLQDIEGDVEEAAAALGASRWTTLWRVVFPLLLPSLLTGTALSFARAVGEYGSIVFISGNMPMKTEIAALLIVTRLEQFDYDGATAIAMVMLVASFVLMLTINLLQAWARRFEEVS